MRKCPSQPSQMSSIQLSVHMATRQVTGSDHSEDDTEKFYSPRSEIDHRAYRVVPSRILLDEGNKSSHHASIWEYVKPYVPRTLDAYRYGIQQSVCLLIAMIPMFAGDFNTKYFYNEAHWIAIQSTVVVDSTAGASVLKIIDRVLGTVIAAAYMMSTFAILAYAYPSSDDFKRIEWITYALVLVMSVLAGWVKPVFPSRISLSNYLLGTTLVFAGIVANPTLNLEKAAGYRVLSVFLGTLISGLVTGFVVPFRVRSKLQTEMSRILKTMSQALSKLVQLQTGMMEPGSIVDRLDDVHFVTQQSSSTCDVEIMNNEDLRQKNNHIETNHDLGDEEVIKLDLHSTSDTHSSFKDKDKDNRGSHESTMRIDIENKWIQMDHMRTAVGDALQESWKILFDEVTHLTAAKYEWVLTEHPHRFPSEVYSEVFMTLRIIYFHLSSLWSTLDDPKEEVEVLKEGSKWIIEKSHYHHKVSNSFFDGLNHDEKENKQFINMSDNRNCTTRPTSSGEDVFYDFFSNSDSDNDDKLSSEFSTITEMIHCEELLMLQNCHPTVNMTLSAMTLILEASGAASSGLLLLSQSLQNQNINNSNDLEECLRFLFGAVDRLRAERAAVTFTRTSFLDAIAKGDEKLNQKNKMKEDESPTASLLLSPNNYLSFKSAVAYFETPTSSAAIGESPITTPMYQTKAKDDDLETQQFRARLTAAVCEHLEDWIGTDPETYRQWDKKTKKFFWQCYWTTDEKLRLTVHLLETLAYSISSCADAIAELINVQTKSKK